MVEARSLIRTMIEITENFQAARQEIMDEHPNFDQIKDARISIFTNCIVALDGVYICFIVRSFELWDDKWWKKMQDLIGEIRRPQQKHIDWFVGGFDSFTVTAYFSLLFIAIENGIRSFYKHVCPSKKEPHAIFNVYDDILKELELTRYFELMEILRLIRNAVMHQNGIHHGNDEKLDWDEKTITFTKGKSIDYSGKVWEVLPSISQGVMNMLKLVVKSDKIIQVPEIIDPSYAHL
jgi:hypothetical protein